MDVVLPGLLRSLGPSAPDVATDKGDERALDVFDLACSNTDQSANAAGGPHGIPQLIPATPASRSSTSNAPAASPSNRRAAIATAKGGCVCLCLRPRGVISGVCSGVWSGPLSELGLAGAGAFAQPVKPPLGSYIPKVPTLLAVSTASLAVILLDERELAVVIRPWAGYARLCELATDMSGHKPTPAVCSKCLRTCSRAAAWAESASSRSAHDDGVVVPPVPRRLCESLG